MVINDVGSHIPMAALERIGTYVRTNPVFNSYEAYKEHLKIIAAPFGLKTEAQWDQIARSSVRITADGKAHSNCDPGIGDSFRTTAVADIDLSPFWNALPGSGNAWCAVRPAVAGNLFHHAAKAGRVRCRDTRSGARADVHG
jgi:hypothetical protein